MLVDGTGAQYREVAARRPGCRASPCRPAAAPRATGQAVALVAAALSPPVLAQLAEISADSPQSITLVLRDGRTVSWGSADAARRRRRCSRPCSRQPGTHFDVSSPDLVVVR